MTLLNGVNRPRDQRGARGMCVWICYARLLRLHRRPASHQILAHMISILLPEIVLRAVEITFFSPLALTRFIVLWYGGQRKGGRGARISAVSAIFGYSYCEKRLASRPRVTVARKCDSQYHWARTARSRRRTEEGWPRSQALSVSRRRESVCVCVCVCWAKLSCTVDRSAVFRRVRAGG